MFSLRHVDRGLLVFSIWAVLGFLGLGFVLEGFSRGAYFMSLLGTGLIVAGFVAHIIVNFMCGGGFTSGEAALGVGSFGILALVFIIGWAGGTMPASNFYSGLTLFGVIILGFITYLTLRYGMRGAFSRFHGKTAPVRETRR